MHVNHTSRGNHAPRRGGGVMLRIITHASTACDILTAVQCIISSDIDCGYLDAPENGTVSVSGTTYNLVATYSCDPGYGLIGDAMRTCLATGNWSGSEPTCTSKLYDSQILMFFHVYHVKFSVGLRYFFPYRTLGS